MVHTQIANESPLVNNINYNILSFLYSFIVVIMAWSLLYGTTDDLIHRVLLLELDCSIRKVSSFLFSIFIIIQKRYLCGKWHLKRATNLASKFMEFIYDCFRSFVLVVIVAALNKKIWISILFFNSYFFIWQKTEENIFLFL